jgi:hypothetical protein
MEKRYKILLSLILFDNILSGWLQVWWIKIFAEMVHANTFSYRNIISSCIAILSMGLLIFLKKENPSFRFLFILLAISYSSLLGLMVSCDAFLLISAVVGTSVGSAMSAYSNSLKVQNIDHNYRNKFDNRSQLVSNIGIILGASFSIYTLLSDVQIWIIWLAIYILFDLDFFTTYILVKIGILKYEKLLD